MTLASLFKSCIVLAGTATLLELAPCPSVTALYGNVPDCSALDAKITCRIGLVTDELSFCHVVFSEFPTDYVVAVDFADGTAAELAELSS